MTEAVIVAAARSPVGRAHKGSLVDMRPDDLLETIARTALEKVPELDPRDLDDVYVGCARPEASRANIARVVAVQLGLDAVPGATVNRYCASCLQTIRMAFHAIQAGEGDAFICGRRRVRLAGTSTGNADRGPSTDNSLFLGGKARTERSRGGAALGRPAGRRPAPRRLHRDGPDGRERRRGSRASAAGEQDEFGVRVAAARGEGASRTGSASARSRR